MADRDNRTPKTPPVGIQAQIAPEGEFESAEEGTGTHSGEALKTIRANRPTKESILRLYEKHDKLDEKVDKIDVNVSKISGQMDVLPKLVSLLEGQLKVKSEDNQLILKQTLEVGGHEAKVRADTQSFVIQTKWKL